MTKTLSRAAIATSILDEVYGHSPQNGFIASRMMRSYDTSIGNPYTGEPVTEAAADIWVAYPGGSTAHNTAERIVARWIEERLV